MSSTVLETTRAAHEEVERVERLIVKELQNAPASQKERLQQSHRVLKMIDRIVFKTEQLVDIYEDKDNVRKDEIEALGGLTASGKNVFSAFYDRLKEIREYHRKHPAARVVSTEDDIEAEFKQEPVIEFSGEEALGRYLDLHVLYNQYINSKFGEPVEYSKYVDEFSQLHKIPRKFKITRQYKEYLTNLYDYLSYFIHRTEPLQDLDRIFSKVETDFEEKWVDGKVEGWEDDVIENGDLPSDHTVIDLDYYSTPEELMEVGPDRLKEALTALGLKAGGTLQQRAERLFLTKHTPIQNLDKKHFAKGPRPTEKNGVALVPKQDDDRKEIALMEAKVERLCDLLNETIERTKDNIVKKQSLTYDEIVEDREEEETEVDAESDDEDQQIYNPLKLPMGWDGKPIPYWLYKLHGLGQEFKCEICGNYSYWGRRAFERHFKEWRHQHGMRCLGIPNTKNFNEITSIEEAKELWKKIQERQGVNKWRPDLEEEYEDREGNIYNKKTFTDLQRQGLI